MSSGELVWFQLIYGKFFPVNEINLLVWNPVFSYPSMWFACEELVLNSVQKFKGMTDNLSPGLNVWTGQRCFRNLEIFVRISPWLPPNTLTSNWMSRPIYRHLLSSQIRYVIVNFAIWILLNWLCIIQKLPALSAGDVTISGISSIALFLAPKPLKGKDSLEEAQILQWINLAEHEILPAVLALTDNSAAAKPSQNRARQEILHYLDVLNKVLLTRTYLVGETVTLADVSVVCTLVPVFDRVMDAATRSKSSNVLRWYNTITPQPNVKHVLGETK